MNWESARREVGLLRAPLSLGLRGLGRLVLGLRAMRTDSMETLRIKFAGCNVCLYRRHPPKHDPACIKPTCRDTLAHCQHISPIQPDLQWLASLLHLVVWRGSPNTYPPKKWPRRHGFCGHPATGTPAGSRGLCGGDELFLVKGSRSGLWQLPGGMIEAGSWGGPRRASASESHGMLEDLWVLQNPFQGCIWASGSIT